MLPVHVSSNDPFFSGSLTDNMSAPERWFTGVAGVYLSSGQSLSLAGPSRTGKTTLLYIAAGNFLQKFTDRNVVWIAAEPVFRCDRMATIFQARFQNIKMMDRVQVYKPPGLCHALRIVEGLDSQSNLIILDGTFWWTNPDDRVYALQMRRALGLVDSNIIACIQHFI